MNARNSFKALQWFTCLVLVGWLSACSDAPDESLLTQVVEQRLSKTFEQETFSLTSLRRLGSGPLPDSPDGKPQRIAYYNAVLTLERDHDFSAWGGLNAAAFANLLGATRQGVEGLAQGGNNKGDSILVHGTATFIRDKDAWQPVAYVSPHVGTPASEYQAGPTSESKRLIEKISALFERETTDPKQQRQIIQEELDSAYSTIEIQLDRLNRAFIIAGGPADGEYVKIAKLLAKAMANQGIPANALTSSGSADNLQLLRRGRADVALVQNDTADLAVLGSEPFHHAGPFYELRALASLFPEPLHVVVAKKSSIKHLSELAGKRVEIGKPNSGSRINSIALLNTAGLSLDDLGAIHETGLKKGLRMLSQGQIDAVIATVSAPARSLQEATAANRIRLLSLAPDIQEALTTENPEFVPIVLPASTYPNQHSSITTVAVTALLVASDGLPKREVDQVLNTLFERIDFLRAGSAAGSLVSKTTAKIGVTIPMHPAAIEFFGGQETGTSNTQAASGDEAATGEGSP